jgi:hypothetical protein
VAPADGGKEWGWMRRGLRAAEARVTLCCLIALQQLLALLCIYNHMIILSCILASILMMDRIP